MLKNNTSNECFPGEYISVHSANNTTFLNHTLQSATTFQAVESRIAQVIRSGLAKGIIERVGTSPLLASKNDYNKTKAVNLDQCNWIENSLKDQLKVTTIC